MFSGISSSTRFVVWLQQKSKLCAVRAGPFFGFMGAAAALVFACEISGLPLIWLLNTFAFARQL